ncbi:MAG: hypothetical protein AABZ55_05805, partial [Bdellovibrionota bacterium]
MILLPENQTLNRLFFILTAFALIFCGGIYFYFWELGFDADFGMIALIAKSILTRGEHPIFVWQVGYNGILVLSHAMALVFKLFGSNAYTANIAPALFFILFLIAFFKVNRLYFGPTLALLIILLIALSSPSFYNRVLR